LGLGRIAARSDHSYTRKAGVVRMRSVPASRRLSRRDITQERKKQQTKEQLTEFAYTLAKGLEWTMLFFGLLLWLVIALVLFLSGHALYAIPFLLVGGVVAAALLKRDPA
jgi:hypothetical protein